MSKPLAKLNHHRSTGGARMSEPRRYWLMVTELGTPIFTSKYEHSAINELNKKRHIWPNATVIEVQEIQAKDPQ
jgi:hypothetical protein